MMKPLRHLAIAALLLGNQFAMPRAGASETFHTCAGFIPSAPATISTQGVWCLDHDLSTAQTSGAAITLANNNITIDCNGYKIGGLAAGNGSAAYGVYAHGRQNAIVRNCNIRGFKYGVLFDGTGGGHLVEDNRLDNSLYVGIWVTGDDNLVRRNAIYATGGYANGGEGWGIAAQADVLDNAIVDIDGRHDTNPGDVHGIDLYGRGSRAAGNHAGGLVPGSGKSAHGIVAHDAYQVLEQNQVEAGTGGTSGVGVSGLGASDTFCVGNLAFGFATGISGCHDLGGNAAH